MSTSTARVAESRYSLEHHGIQNVNTVYWNLSTPLLYEEALRRHEGRGASWTLGRPHGAIHRAIAARQIHRSGTI